MTHLGHMESHGRAGAGFQVPGKGLLATHQGPTLLRTWGPVPGTSSGGWGDLDVPLAILVSPGGHCLQQWDLGSNALRNQVGQKSTFPSSGLPAASQEEEQETQCS